MAMHMTLTHAMLVRFQPFLPFLFTENRGDIVDDQKAKADYGKPRLSLVPRQVIWDVAYVREYGHKKYGDGADDWDKVKTQRYRDAAYRHFMAYLDDPTGVDNESGLPHLSHLACNIAFLCESEKRERQDIITEDEDDIYIIRRT